MTPLEFSQWSLNNSLSGLCDAKLGRMYANDISHAELREAVMKVAKTIEEQSRLLGRYEGHPECRIHAEEAEETLDLCYKKLDMLL